jgi:Zn-dependent protease
VSWFLIFLLITMSLSDQLRTAVGRPGEPYLLFAVLTSLAFFGSVLLHELGHVLLALREKIPVRAITLFIFGGVAEITHEPKTPGAEFRIAIAGPIVSLLLAGAFGLLASVLPNRTLLDASVAYLAIINLSLAVFNIIPGFPLDGGRVLRAAVWRFTGSFQRATQIAAGGGRLVAFGFFGLAILDMLRFDVFGAMWMALIGYFLLNAANQSLVQSKVQTSLTGVNVGDVMDRSWSPVPEITSLEQIVSQRAVPNGERAFLVLTDAEPRGIVTLTDIMKIPERVWRYTTVRQIMTPWERVVRLQPTASLTDALQLMERTNVQQIPVVTGNVIMGILSRESIVRYLQLRGAFRA